MWVLLLVGKNGENRLLHKIQIIWTRLINDYKPRVRSLWSPINRNHDRNFCSNKGPELILCICFSHKYLTMWQDWYLHLNYAIPHSWFALLALAQIIWWELVLYKLGGKWNAVVLSSIRVKYDDFVAFTKIHVFKIKNAIKTLPLICLSHDFVWLLPKYTYTRLRMLSRLGSNGIPLSFYCVFLKIYRIPKGQTDGSLPPHYIHYIKKMSAESCFSPLP